ncbi:glutathione-independent formaldehyde dehydrogenase [Pseudonocardia hierapolitana]|uniref:Glutathione-independent formaldehyde dehydrogenase n=1 Tax=Pseudonocardia hierapolitana TaxID=1128676 RepID=A0A561T5K3_9PSEU|nr:glutathione-independent formaldehyde dehydrogenase [Pseudonocardia hierapolitana]TWF82388.1 glutathione-independent formaldehyde dehydrogenase [Pseudonocardia hierapolitana]
MRAVVYRKPFDLAVEEVPDPRIEHPNDVVVRITSTGISGSDLHLYEGRTAAEPGIVFGHENLGIVEDVGSGVTGLERGDRVVMPFNIACGFCKNCVAGLSGFCLTVNPQGVALGVCGNSAIAPYPGGQAEYLRVPFADFNCMLLPPGIDHESDYTLLADVFAAGYHGCELAGVSPGETVAVFGAGALGLMAAYCALLRGAAQVFVVDRVPARLATAREIGAVAIDLAEGDPVQQIRDLTGGEGTDRGIDATGHQVVAASGNRSEPAAAPNQALNLLVQVVRPAGSLGVPGHCVPSDPGRLPFALDALFEKGLRVGTGQANVKRYNRQLRDLITQGRASPGFVVSHELPLAEAPSAYESVERQAEGFTKVILKPEVA